MDKIILDRFPCHLIAVPAGFTDDIDTLKSYVPTDGAKYLEITRVILTDKSILVAKDSQDGPQIVFQEKYDYADISTKPTEDTRITTVSGKMLVFKKDTACGCGSRLRAWNPYRTLNSIKDQMQ
jgi:hypothetical protein